MRKTRIGTNPERVCTEQLQADVTAWMRPTQTNRIAMLTSSATVQIRLRAVAMLATYIMM